MKIGEIFSLGRCGGGGYRGGGYGRYGDYGDFEHHDGHRDYYGSSYHHRGGEHYDRHRGGGLLGILGGY